MDDDEEMNITDHDLLRMIREAQQTPGAARVSILGQPGKERVVVVKEDRVHHFQRIERPGQGKEDQR